MSDIILRLTIKLVLYNPLYIVSDRAWVNNILRNASIRDSRFIIPERTNITTTIASSNSSV